MCKTVVIHQPDFAPYLGFFHRLLHCDYFVLLDHVQFSKGGWHNRDKIKGPQGIAWLTIPIDRKVELKKINKVHIENSSDWRTKHLDTIKSYYKKAGYFNEIMPMIEGIYKAHYDLMVDINMAFMKLFFELFSLKVNYCFSSSLKIDTKKNHAIIDIVKKVGGDRYLSGTGAKDYVDYELFKEQGIKLIWQEFKHPVYPQLHGEFVPFLSSVDLLFNCGIEKSRKILRSC